MSKTPEIMRREADGSCWQVEFWPEAGVATTEDGRRRTDVALKRGELVITVPVETIFEQYTVVC